MAKGLTTMKVIAMSLVFMIIIVFVGLIGFIAASNNTGSLGSMKIGSQAFKNSIKRGTSLIFKNKQAEKLHEAVKSVNFPLKAGYYFTNDRVLRINEDFETPSFSISAWIKVAKTDDNYFNVIMSNREPGCQVLTNKYGFALLADPSDGTIHYIWSTPTNGCSDLSSPIDTIQFDHWLHVAIVISSSQNTELGSDLIDSTISMYINGLIVNTIKTSRYINTGKPLYIGSWNDKSDLFVGRMSTIQFWSEALSDYDLSNLSRGSFSFPADLFSNNLLKSVLFLSLEEPEYINLEDDHLELILISADELNTSDNNDKLTEFDDDDIDTRKRSELLRKQRANKNKTQKQSSEKTKKENDQDKSIKKSMKESISKVEKKTSDTKSSTVNTENNNFDTTPVTNAYKLRGSQQNLDDFLNELETADAITLAMGEFNYRIPDSIKNDYHALAMQRADLVKATCKWNWDNYKKYAWGHDELHPVTGDYEDNWGAMGMTLIDALDTLYLMGMKKEFKEAKEWIRKNLDMNKNIYASTFETNIRVVGGLLAAYDLDKDPMFLEKAKEMADRLLPAFNTPSGYPYASVNLVTGNGRQPSWNGGNAILAELGTMSLEYRYLSSQVKDPKYAQAVNKIYETIGKQSSWDGLQPVYMSSTSGAPVGGQYSMGASADSYYEYLVKAWIQGGKKEDLLKRLYNEAVEGMNQHLLQRSTPSKLLYFAEVSGRGSGVKREMGHLACFAGGMLALGVYHDINPATRERDLKNAKSLAYTCYQMYHRSPTGVGPESTRFNMGDETSVNPGAPYYILRPEAVETLYILNQLTGDPIYREWGWEMWMAVEKRTKTNYGHGHIHNVANTNATPDNREESFWFGETLKYYYLLFNDDKLVDLNKQVFNTEAHPFTVINSNGETF